MPAQVVSFHCVMKNVTGKVLHSSFNHEVLNCAPPGVRVELPGLSKAMQAVKKGERRRITLDAAEAYGLYDPSLTTVASRRSLRCEQVERGDRVHLAGPDGAYHLYRVVTVEGDRICLDANHPLAGQDLILEVHVTDARDATALELAEAGEQEPREYLH